MFNLPDGQRHYDGCPRAQIFQTMKKFMFIASVALGVAALAGCSKEETKTEPVSEPEFTGNEVLETVPFTGGTVSYEFETNRAWSVTKSGATQASAEAYEPEIAPISGNAGKNKIELTFPANKTQQEIKFSFTITLDKSATTKSVDASKAYTKTVEVTIAAPSVTDAAGNVYKVVYLKDGNFWMAENLRYVPEGLTPAKDLKNVTAGVYYPVKLNGEHTALEFTDDEQTIKSSGYLYQGEVALGVAVNSIKSEEDAKKFEGTQGICPKGWHIPTSTEILNLVGKAASLETNDKAPYYDKDKQNATIELLNADGFNLSACGCVSIIDNTKDTGAFMGWLKANPNIIGSGYIYGSSFAGISYKTANDPTSGVKNVQFHGLMPMGTTGTANGSKISYKIASSVRCVMNQPAN